MQLLLMAHLGNAGAYRLLHFECLPANQVTKTVGCEHLGLENIGVRIMDFKVFTFKNQTQGLSMAGTKHLWIVDKSLFESEFDLQ